jgi:hypothetical protein
VTYKILKSTAGSIADFEKKVAQHVVELKFWHDREKIVAQEAKAPLGDRPAWGDFKDSSDPATDYRKATAKWDADKLARHDPVKRPSPHPAVENAVRQNGDDFVADYEIVNDDPTPDQILRGKKNALLSSISRIEQDAKERAMPAIGKRRMASLREMDIVVADEKIRQEIWSAIPEEDRPKFDLSTFPAEIEKRRHPADTQHLKDTASCKSRLSAIERAAAQAMSDVEDLTAENIDDFKIPSFQDLKG